MRGLRPFRRAKSLGSLTFAGLVVGLAASACAGPTWGYPDTPGRLVGVRVEVSGSATPLYPDPKGTGRYYLEAREGAGYEIHLANRTRERLGVVVTVDGLNVVSGERDAGRGRMYILDPWGATSIRGWRLSLHDVHRFTFVDEKASYASRAGKASGRMGWIEVSVYREKSRVGCCHDREGRVSPEAFERGDAAEPAPSPAPEAQAEAKSADEREESAGRGSLGASRAPAAPRPRFPGTGWGSRVDDPVMVVSFEPEGAAAERLAFRYEYASALRTLGIRPWPEVGRDRLRERERGECGFAEPPPR